MLKWRRIILANSSKNRRYYFGRLFRGPFLNVRQFAARPAGRLTAIFRGCIECPDALLSARWPCFSWFRRVPAMATPRQSRHPRPTRRERRPSRLRIRRQPRLRLPSPRRHRHPHLHQPRRHPHRRQPRRRQRRLRNRRLSNMTSRPFPRSCKNSWTNEA